MKRFATMAAILAALVLAVAALAEPVGPTANWVQRQLQIRHTNAANNFALPPWTAGVTPAYVDSGNFVKVGTTIAGAGNLDTTVAIPWADVSLVNMMSADSTLFPSMQLTVIEDSLGAPFPSGVTTIASALDSIHVAMQWSANGVDWIPLNGTPTWRFQAAASSPINGSIDLIGIEGTAPTGEDQATILFRPACLSQSGQVANTIANRVSFLPPGHIRFILAGDYTGRFKVLLNYTRSASAMNQ